MVQVVIDLRMYMPCIPTPVYTHLSITAAAALF